VNLASRTGIGDKIYGTNSSIASRTWREHARRSKTRELDRDFAWSARRVGADLECWGSGRVGRKSAFCLSVRGPPWRIFAPGTSSQGEARLSAAWAMRGPTSRHVSWTASPGRFRRAPERLGPASRRSGNKSAMALTGDALLPLVGPSGRGARQNRRAYGCAPGRGSAERPGAALEEGLPVARCG